MKNLSYLIESELEKAEVVLAAKSVTDAIQKMAENVAKMEAEDVMPLNDPIREHFGPEAATKFAEAVGSALRELTQKLSDSKTAISNEIARMQGELTDEPSSDLDGMGDEEMSDEIPAPEAGGDLDIEIPDVDATADDEVGNLGGEDEPRFDDEDLSKAAGRARKESAAPKKRILETRNPDLAVAREYAALVRAGNSPSKAAATVTESYGIEIKTLIAIMESVSGASKK